MTRYDDNIYIAGLQSLYNVGAAHVRSFIDDFGGVKSNSEKLIWKNLSIFA